MISIIIIYSLLVCCFLMNFSFSCLIGGALVGSGGRGLKDRGSWELLECLTIGEGSLMRLDALLLTATFLDISLGSNALCTSPTPCLVRLPSTSHESLESRRINELFLRPVWLVDPVSKRLEMTSLFCWNELLLALSGQHSGLCCKNFLPYDLFIVVKDSMFDFAEASTRQEFSAPPSAELILTNEFLVSVELEWFLEMFRVEDDGGNFGFGRRIGGLPLEEMLLLLAEGRKEWSWPFAPILFWKGPAFCHKSIWLCSAVDLQKFLCCEVYDYYG